MNTYRMFAFAAVILLMAFLFRVIADRYLHEQPSGVAVAKAPDRDSH
jgi:hypothetical protein